jgi:hypothetical protein
VLRLYFYDSLETEVLFKDDKFLLVEGRCADCDWSCYVKSWCGEKAALTNARTKFRNHIAKGSDRLCLSGTKTQRGDDGRKLQAPPYIGAMVP